MTRNKRQSRSRIMKTFLFLIVLTLSHLENAHSSQRLIVTGSVIDESQKPISGVMVTYQDNKKLLTKTVFTKANGEFVIELEWSENNNFRLRKLGFEDLNSSILYKKNNLKNLVLKAHHSDESFSNSLPASLHASRLKFENQNLKTEFVSQCTFCHQQGNALTRRPRPRTEWVSTIQRMEGMGALLTWEAQKLFPNSLVNYFDGTPLRVKAELPYQDELATTVITEWILGTGISYIHDIEIGPTEKIYGVDMGLDLLTEIDPQSNERKEWALPESGLPLGGMLSGAYNPLGTLDARHGPHSIQLAPDNLLWTTNSLSGELHSFDVNTETFERFKIPNGVYPHTLRFDKVGRIWFTMALSNQIARFDPKTKEFKIINLPSSGFIQWVSAKLVRPILKFAGLFPRQNLHIKLSSHNWTGEGSHVLPLPYGVDFNPKDDSIWYSKVYEGVIGRVDPNTFEVKEIRTPLKGPRRMRFSKKTGELWIPSFTENALMKFNPETNEFKTYNLPPLAPTDKEAPYALNIHPESGDVWITGGTSDRLFRFIPDQERFVSYPLPTQVTFMREIVFAKNGSVCTSYSNLPAAAIEGGRPKIVCLKP